MASEPGRTCETCGAALDPAQRYCLSCGGRAGSRFVTLGEHAQDSVEILSGLSPGDQVIFPAPASLADGAPVDVRP